MTKFIPLSVPSLKGNELKYTTDAINTEWVSTVGAYVAKFEQQMAEYVNSIGAVACQSGTSGLHVALIVLDIKDGHEVLVPTLTFIAAVNPVRYVNAEPVFMDCDDSLCIDTIKLWEFCQNECDFTDDRKLINKKTGRHIKAVIVVHVFGNMADMNKIMELAEKYNLKVIEDATEAVGTYYTSGKYQGRFAGTIGHIGVYSFNGNKIITSGGGGMIISSDEKYLKHAKHLTTQAKSDELYSTHDEIGYNYRMTNVQAAIGLAQLEQLEKFIAVKKDNFNEYKRLFEGIDNISLICYRDDIRCNYWFYAMFVDDDYKMTSDEIIKYLDKNKVQARPVWGLIHEQKPYESSLSYKIEKAYYYHKHIVNIPCSVNLSHEDTQYIADLLK